MLSLKNVQHDFDVDPGEIGITVRKGNKWADIVDSGECAVELWECKFPHKGSCSFEKECVFRGEAELLGYWYGPIYEIPTGLLKHEHEKAFRDYEGLMKSMKRAYGEEAIEDDTEVTALIYLRKYRI